MQYYLYAAICVKAIVLCLFLCMLGSYSAVKAEEWGVIKVPVVDMIADFLVFNELPAAREINSCHRAHQGLYNERVRVLNERGDYVHVAYKSLIYFDSVTKQPRNSFWMRKRDLLLFSDIKNEELLMAMPDAVYAQDATVVLTYPWHGFSVGTRFKRKPGSDTVDSYAIMLPDYENNSVILDYIARTDALVEQEQNVHEARMLFVKIINELVDRVQREGTNFVIPYVLGGSSFVELYTDLDADNTPLFYVADGVWQRVGAYNPYMGYDCSELVMRFAQMAGIAFPWKTTVAMERSLRSLTSNDMLEEGDLIWVYGHIMIVSNLEKNELIEARGYSSGYGRVHKIVLKDCFAGVSTYDELRIVCENGGTVQFKDWHGSVLEKTHAVKLLKLIG